MTLLRLSRRSVLLSGAAAAGASFFVGELLAQGRLSPTPACGGDPTPRQTEGPFFTPNSPERQSLLEAGMKGQVLELSGLVLTHGCQPVRRALLDSGCAGTSSRTARGATGCVPSCRRGIRVARRIST